MLSSDNVSSMVLSFCENFLEGLITFIVIGSLRQKQVCDALRCSGLHARYTDMFNEFFVLARKGLGKLISACRDGDSALQLLHLNEEFLVGALHQSVPITSLPFVHTARRSYRLNGPVKSSDCWIGGQPPICEKLLEPYHLEEGEVVTRFP